jgi:ArsR family transcriptional regulator, arsenate/arsenite/antimonite-responsive transcriptional repressor / arsenate reductase (thioredoxin)
MRQTPLVNPSLDFLKLLAHPIRWRVMLALAHSDCRVQELMTVLKQPQNLVSYHLRRLRLNQLVHERRSTADGRDVYYSIDLDKFRTLYQATGQAIHPGLNEPSGSQTLKLAPSTYPPMRVLFLCTHNSARSQMAEGLLRHLGGQLVEVFSAGSEPTTIHPMAIKVMQQLQIDIRQQRSKHMDDFSGQWFDYVITVCDRLRESCPVFPGDPEHIHWSFPDPVAVEGSAPARERAFHETGTQLTTRINYLLLMIDRSRREKKNK